MCPVILLLMWITSPISWPLAKILDCWLGHHPAKRYNHQQLELIVKMHSKDELAKEHRLPKGVEGLENLQVKLIDSALKSFDISV